MRQLVSFALALAVMSGALSAPASGGTAAANEGLRPYAPDGHYPASASAPAPAPASAWQDRYLEARAVFVQGRFAEATARFHEIAENAPDVAMRARAGELEAIARYWWQRGFLLSPAVGAPPPVQALLEDKRSADELAVLYGNALVWGTGFGVTVGVAADGGKAATFFLPAIGMSLAGLGTIALLDKTGEPLRYGVPNSITTGLYIGLEVGLFSGLTWIGASDKAPHPGAIAGILWGSSTGGAVLGGVLGHVLGGTPGRASLISSGALWGGFLSSFATAGLVEDSQSAKIAAPVAGLVGTSLGATMMAVLAHRISPSIARVRLIDLAALGGGLLFGGLYASAAASDFEPRPFYVLAGLGAGIGLGVGAFATRTMERDEPRRAGIADITLLPSLAPTKGGGTLGVMGAF